MAGASHMKFAFVGRRNPKDNTKHVILGTYGIDTKSFAAQLNLNYPLCWGILNHVVSVIFNHGEQSGEQTCDYIFIKDPNKATMRLYKKTADDLDDEDEDEEL
jgi:translation initiation factor 3 subunit D